MKSLLITLLVVATAYARTVVVKRQTDPLEAVVQQLSATVDELQSQVQSLQNKVDQSMQTSGGSRPTVAFMAQYSADNAIGVAAGPYVFDNAILNIGNSYDENTGIFTAPVSGVYLIAVQLFTDGGQSEHPFVDIKVNGNTAARLAFDEGNGQEDSDSTTITTQLQAGDKVWIASEENAAYHYWGGYHTFFTGTLIATTPASTTQMPVTFIA